MTSIFVGFDRYQRSGTSRCGARISATAYHGSIRRTLRLLYQHRPSNPLWRSLDGSLGEAVKRARASLICRHLGDSATPGRAAVGRSHCRNRRSEDPVWQAPPRGIFRISRSTVKLDLFGLWDQQSDLSWFVTFCSTAA